jgi:hypothetical protein
MRAIDDVDSREKVSSLELRVFLFTAIILVSLPVGIAEE